jgi:nucleoside-diphosphate-sugar epimerase
MLKHYFSKPLLSGRALILGAGFVGGEVARRLAFKGWKVSALRSADLDLTIEKAGEKLSAHFDAGDLSALDALKAHSAGAPDDIALAYLVKRLEQVGPGGVYDLD